MRTKKKQVPHVCNFTKKSKIFDSFFPPGAKCGKIRRKFREFMLVSEENGRKCHTSQGSAGYFFEKEKQLTQHYYMIHPYSKFREYWECLIIIEIIICLTIRLFFVSQFSDTYFCTFQYQIPALFVDLFELADVGISFLTGYVNKETQGVVLEVQKILRYHLRRAHFLCNIVSSLPLEYIIFLATRSNCPQGALIYVIFIKITKLGLMTKYLAHIAKIHRWSELCVRTVWVLLTMFILSHWLSCLFYMIVHKGNFVSEGSGGEYIRHFKIFYMVTRTFFFQNGVTSQLTLPITLHYFFSTILLIVVDLSNVVFMGLFVHLLGLLRTPLIEYEKMVQEVQKFLLQENLPKRIHEKVRRYFEFRFRYRYFREKIILETLSPPLRREIANFLCKNLLMHPESIFNGLPDDLAGDLCMKMELEVFLDGDIIFRAGRKATKAYFIYCGSAVMYSPRGKEIMHLHQGQQFDEAAFLIENRHIVTVISLEISEYYVLRYRDFQQCVKGRYEYQALIRATAQERRDAIQAKIN